MARARAIMQELPVEVEAEDETLCPGNVVNVVPVLP